MADQESINDLAEALVGELTAAGKRVATAESCSGGWIAKSLTDINGSSRCFGYGIVSYSNAAKESLLGVGSQTLLEQGAVSEAVVGEMAIGVLHLSGAEYSVAVSGIAGPDGGTEEKPVGTVWFAWAVRNGNIESLETKQHLIKGDRESIRAQTVILALQGIRERLRTSV
jgi:nicotinamide-nucleotide amidase